MIYLLLASAPLAATFIYLVEFAHSHRKDLTSLHNYCIIGAGPTKRIIVVLLLAPPRQNIDHDPDYQSGHTFLGNIVENHCNTTTGAHAPILWKKANRGVGARECESLSFAFVFSTAWTTKNPNANSYHLGLLVVGCF